MKVFVLDVDGVMTDGQFHYTSEGKVMKIFGSDDHDVLSMLKPFLHLHFVTGDHRGFDISKARIVDDMKMSLDLVSTIKRIDWIKERWNPNETIYMGDGVFDHYVFREVGYSIAPFNASEISKSFAKYITKAKGGDRAVAEAGLHIMEKFFTSYDPLELPDKQIKLSGEWAV